MKRVICCTALCLCAVGAAPAAEPEVEVTLAAASRYVWRGLAAENDRPVFDPSVSVAWRGFNASVWALFPAESFTEADGGWDHSETDYTLSYSRELGGAELTGGVVYYTLPASGGFTHEAFVEAALPDLPLAPTLGLYRDLGDCGSLYASVAVSHEVEIAAVPGLSLCLGAGLGWGDRRYVKDAFGLNRAALCDIDVSASVGYALSDAAEVSVTVRHSWFVDDSVRDAVSDPAAGYGDAAPVVASVSVAARF
jgi:hypothetical protein